MSRVLVFLASFTSLAISTGALALDPKKAITQYVHDVWQTDQGLPHAWIHVICQTRDGYLWLGTVGGGLARFDGVRFTVFDKANTPELKGNIIGALREDRDGNLWVGTDGGLNRYRDGKFTAFTRKGGSLNFQYGAIYEDRKGNLWFGTDKGLNRFRDGAFTVFTTKDGLSNDVVTSAYEDREGSLWVGTNRGLNRFRDGQFVVFTTSDGLSDDSIRAIIEDREGSLWIATEAGLSRYRNGQFTVFTLKDGLSSSLVVSVYEDRDGSIWVGGFGGLNRFNDGRFVSYTSKDGLPTDVAGGFIEDREGSLWFATRGGGLNRFRDGKFTTFGMKEGLSSDIVDSIYEDREGSLWMGTYGGGLNRLEGGRFSSFTKKDGLSSDRVVRIFEDQEGSLWIEAEGGLNRLKDGRLTVFGSKDGLSSDVAFLPLQGRDGSLWFGTDKGLNRFRDGKFTIYTTKDGLSSDIVVPLHEDRDGSLWIATDKGLNRFRNGKFTTYTTKDGLSSNDVASVYEDRDGNLWFGTDKGLDCYRNGKFTSYTARDGLLDDTILGVLEDDRENLWLSCPKGVVRASKAELAAFASGKIRKVRCVSYGAVDGMRSPEGNDTCYGVCKTRDGRLWFPTLKGAVTIDPAHILLNTLPPPVVIEEVLVNNTVLSRATPGARVDVPAGKEKLEFHYTANSFLVPQRVKFKYRLEGFDEDWVDAGTARFAQYTHLPPREYTFRVIACNDDGVWNEKGASFDFVLLPHLWQRPWLQGLAAIVVLAGALGVQRRRLDKRKTRELAAGLRSAELERKTQELEHARRIQLALLPKEALTVGQWTVAGAMQTATEVGGDYFGYLEAGGRLCVVIGDATGHGMASGLVAGMLKSALASLSQTAVGSDGPARWLDHLNTALRTSIAQRGLGICIGVALVDVETGEVGLGMAGVPHPFLVSRSGVSRLALSGTPLGYLKKIVAATTTRLLAPGDRLVLITDGLIEQMNESGEDWGYAGVEAALSTLCCGGAAPAEIAQVLLATCARYGANRPQSDDRTVVVLVRRDTSAA